MKNNSIDVCFQVVNIILKLLNDIMRHTYQPKFRRIYLESNIVQNDFLSYAGAMKFLFEIGFIDDGNN